MTITEQEMKYFADVAYWVDGKKQDKKFLPEEGTIRKIPKAIKGSNVEYKILKTEDNTTSGMQAMAVAPIKNNKVDTSEIVIAYAGTNKSDVLDLLTDAQTVVGRNKKLFTYETFKPSKSSIDGQIITAEKFAKAVKKEYPNAVMTTTGHSLGEYIALYIASENGWKNVGFNGPDPYGILSQEAKDWIEKNPGNLFNYRNVSDVLGNANGNGTGAEIRVDMDMGRHVKNTMAFHNLSTWKFDKKGNLIIKETFENKEARQVHAEKRMYAAMIELASLARKLKASGRGLSTAEGIYLNDMEALLAVESSSQIMKISMEFVIKTYQDGIIEVEKIWATGVQRAQSIGSQLSYGEILGALAAGGASKATVVHEPTSFYEEKITKTKKMGDSFNRLASEIKASIKELTQSDKDLASQIRQGA